MIEEKQLFKFLPFNRLVDFIENKTIWFSRADKFGDKMECVHISDLLKKPDYKEIEARKRKYLISCWHVANKESLAFWDTHSVLKVLHLERKKPLNMRMNLGL
ncbi:MAG: hypothetical protein ACYDCN_06075 [Bacteroidia bacterium]